MLVFIAAKMTNDKTKTFTNQEKTQQKILLTLICGGETVMLCKLKVVYSVM